MRIPTKCIHKTEIRAFLIFMAEYLRSTNLLIFKPLSCQHIPLSDSSNATWRDAIESSHQTGRWMKEEIEIFSFLSNMKNFVVYCLISL
jgi:hypothetical protein